MRILCVIPDVTSSPISMLFARRQVACLQEAGVVCAPFFLASRTSPATLVREFVRLRKLIRSFRPDVVHAHYGTMTGFLAAVSTTMPFVITYRGSDLNPCPTHSMERRALGMLLSQLAALRADRIICVSEQLRRRLWWRQHSATLIPSGINTAEFYPRPRNEARRALGWDDNQLIVLFNASHAPVLKRLDLAQAAVRVAEAFCGEIRFVVLQGDVAPDTIPIMMSAADALLLTSDWEGSPNVVKEAIACNLPVVSVPVGDVPERLAGVTPSRIVPRNATEIGKALAEILLRRERSDGSNYIGSLSSAATLTKLLAAYDSIIPHAAPRYRVRGIQTSKQHPNIPPS